MYYSYFYIQSNYRTQVEYITSKSLLDRVEDKLAVLANNTHVENTQDSSFKAMHKYWMDEMNESNNRNKETVDFNEKKVKQD